MKCMIAVVTAMGAMFAASLPVHGAQSEAVDAWLRAAVADGRIAAASVAEVDGAEVETQGWGRRAPNDATPPDAQTQYQIGSITKVLTHLLLAEMQQAGVVRATTTIGELMPAPFAPRNPDIARIALGSLATHTSGLPRLPPNLDPANAIDPYAGYDAAALRTGLVASREGQPLGSFYAYSNFGVGTLGHLLGQADGSNYANAVTRRVITPLGLRETSFAPGANAATPVVAGKAVEAWAFDDALAGAGALWSSVDDLARLVQANLGTHEHALRHDLASDREIAVENAGDFAVTPVWHVAGDGEQAIYWHNGGTAGFHSFVGFRPDRQRGIAILVSGDADPTEIGLNALGHVAQAPRPAVVDESILGHYRLSPHFGIDVKLVDGALVAQATGQSPLAIHAVHDDWYGIADVDASLRIVRDDGRVVAIELVQAGRVQTGVRIAEATPQAPAPLRREIPIDAARLDDYVGTFVLAPGIEFVVRRAERGLEVQLSGQPYFPVFAHAQDRFFYKVVEAELQFERDSGGKVIAVVLHQAGVEQRAPRQEARNSSTPSAPQ
jgi:D-alanyl-D-alanine-carboxypeptidase/D-alanyl-D-alanine-endopeptidase